MSELNLTKEKMLACPFCGSSRLTMRHFFVECGNCAALGPNGNSESQATEKWNKRHSFEPNKLHQALYAAVNDMMIVIGMHGSIDRRDDRVTHVMDALHAIDGGVYKPLETREQPRRHFSRNKFDRHLCDTCGADYELHEKDEMGNWCPSNTVGSRHKPECAFHEAQADGMQHPSGACDCGATASENG